MTDERLGEILRAALPQSAADDAPRDLWPSLGSRLDRGPRWSFVDLGLAAAVVATLLMFPEWLWVLAYHL
jgi:hypothetical protein